LEAEEREKAKSIIAGMLNGDIKEKKENQSQKRLPEKLNQKETFEQTVNLLFFNIKEYNYILYEYILYNIIYIYNIKYI
jgi:hypothetical protein